jgi:hypothetical protein
MAGPEDAASAARTLGDVEARADRAHDEIYARVTMSELGWPALLPVIEALEAKALELGRTPSGAPREVMIADWRTAGPDDVGCEVVLPLQEP